MASRPRTRSNKGLTSPSADVESAGAKDGGTVLRKVRGTRQYLLGFVMWLFGCSVTIFFFQGWTNHQALLAFLSFPPYFDVCVNFIRK